MGEVTIQLDPAEAEILLDHHRLRFGGELEELGNLGTSTSLRDPAEYVRAKADVERRERIMRELGWGAETIKPVQDTTDEDELRAAAHEGIESVASDLEHSYRGDRRSDEEYVALAQDAERRLRASRSLLAKLGDLGGAETVAA